MPNTRDNWQVEWKHLLELQMRPLEELATVDERVKLIIKSESQHSYGGSDKDYLLNLAAKLYQQNQQAREIIENGVLLMLHDQAYVFAHQRKSWIDSAKPFLAANPAKGTDAAAAQTKGAKGAKNA